MIVSNIDATSISNGKEMHRAPLERLLKGVGLHKEEMAKDCSLNKGSILNRIFIVHSFECTAVPPVQSPSLITMCCHSRIIYATCGHSTFCPRPLVECRDASFDPSAPWSTTCKIVAHPYKTLRMDQLCPPCKTRRDTLLREIEQNQAVRFDEWQWKVSYGMPGHGEKDYWGKKAEERAEEERRKAEPPSKRKKSSTLKRFSFRKSNKRKSGKVREGNTTPTVAEADER